MSKSSYNQNEVEFCPFCGGEKFKQKTIDRIDYTITELELLCIDCGERINYWAFGWWENNHVMTPEYKQMLRKKKLNEIKKVNKEL